MGARLQVHGPRAVDKTVIFADDLSPSLLILPLKGEGVQQNDILVNSRAGIPSPSLLKRLLKVELGVQQNDSLVNGRALQSPLSEVQEPGPRSSCGRGWAVAIVGETWRRRRRECCHSAATPLYLYSRSTCRCFNTHGVGVPGSK